ncbi:hypothetical protein OPT61_g1506 [Boeremia exigua]|uniref:Uncharacterized protein n=1 Tax=Boeremia exigua TaxID=749465 RepID=A0ACC2IQ38_9PLEO|nr:hypothetical protein OPT61_g1506 [Boeremia exigua]
MSGFTRRRGRAGAPLRGLFVDGVWHCDCDPRQPANHFEVKKQGPNQGKWFRTCQKQQDDKSWCRFFLWDSEAHPREAAALADNSRTESLHTKTPTKRPASPPPPYMTGLENSRASRKRDRATSIDREDEYGFAVTKEAFKDELNHVMAAVETPRKAVKTSEIATPSTRRTLPWNKDESHGLQTPQSARAVQVDPSSCSAGKHLLTPSRSVGASHRTTTSSSSHCDTPTPSRFKDVGGDDLTHDVFSLLQDAGVKLDATAGIDLKVLLSKHTKSAEGLKRGREIARSSIKARDAKITELSYRISTLEAELEAEKALVKHLQWEVETGEDLNGS